MTIQEMLDKAAADSSFVILDVRTPEELTGSLGQIKDVINIPLQQLNQRMDELKV
jgi:rhodanese-related sulfurtransferase